MLSVLLEKGHHRHFFLIFFSRGMTISLLDVSVVCIDAALYIMCNVGECD